MGQATRALTRGSLDTDKAPEILSGAFFTGWMSPLLEPAGLGHGSRVRRNERFDDGRRAHDRSGSDWERMSRIRVMAASNFDMVAQSPAHYL